MVLALPDLYGAFDTSIVAVSWVISSYNLVVAVAALALVPLARRLAPRSAARWGLGVFTAASIGCAASWSLPALLVFRSAQGLGAALVLSTSLPLLAGLTGSRIRAVALWTSVATVGAAAGPALGGVLTQLFDWRAIFAVQAPVAAVALLATAQPAAAVETLPTRGLRRRGALAADAALALLFGALVGALFLAVLLAVTVWGLEPIVGALIVSALPGVALAVRPLVRGLPVRSAVGGGSLLLALGLTALALLPTVSPALVAAALALCGAGLGLAVPVLTGAALDPEADLARGGLSTVGARHAGFVLALALVAPLLTQSLEHGGEQALLGGTRVILDADVPLTKKVPIALDLRDALEKAPKGEVPNLAKPFDERGAAADIRLRRLRDDLVGTLEEAITRGFRSSFGLAALLGVLALLPALRLHEVPP